MRKFLLHLKPATLCFFGGDIFATSFWLLFAGDIGHFILKATGTLIIGVIGGCAGLFGKDLYPVIKKLIKSKLYKNKKKKS